MARGLTHLDAAKIVLREADRALQARDIVREIHRRQLAIVGGKTPDFTINARISEDIKAKGEHSEFKRVARGLYTLRETAGEEYKAQAHAKKINEDDRVLVFPTDQMESVGPFHGVRKEGVERYVDRLLDPRVSFFMNRLEAESTSDVKQVVSYAMLKYRASLLRFTRGKISSVGDYLDGQYSIGFGGHVEQQDWNLFDLGHVGYFGSMRRELKEEVGIELDLMPQPEVVGVLNDDSSELGRRHLAFIHLVELDTPSYVKGEKSVNRLQFVDISQLGEEFGGYEYWSKLCIETYFGDRIDLDSYVQPREGFSLGDRPQLILIVGYIGSGKTEACTLLTREFGYQLVRCSRVLQELIGCGPMEEIGRRRLQDAGLDYVNQHRGHERFAAGILSCMKRHPCDRFVLDGLRYPQTLEALRRMTSIPITVIYIDTMVDNLYRYHQERTDADVSFSEFLDMIHHPVERHIERFRPLADIIVYNHGSRTSYLRVVNQYLQAELG